MRTAIITTLLLLTLGTALADGKVMLVTDINSPDSYAAASAGNYEGIPVLVLVNGSLTENLTSAINEMNPSEVILVGGPVVIKESVGDELREMGYKVTRLWGMERTKTATEVAKYFWYTSPCAVLVEDTYSPARDAMLQAEGVNIAVRKKCPLIPVPEGNVPAELIDTLTSLNVTNITYLARNVTSDMIDSLTGFNVTWINGTISQIRAQVVDMALHKNNALLIIASKNWKDSLVIGAALNNDSLIKWVNSTDNIQEIVSLIENNNLSPVKIVGEPFLAGEIANELKNNGITAVNYVGTRPAAIARRIWKAEKEKFRIRRAVIKKIREKRKAIIVKRVKAILNKTLAKVNDLLIKIEELKSNNENTADLDEMLSQANTSITNAISIANASPEEAQAIAIRKINALRTKLYKKLPWKEELKTEISTRRQLATSINTATIEKTYPGCNTEEIRNLINKAKELKAAAEKESDPAKQAALLKEAKRAYDYARKLKVICVRKGKVPARLKSAAVKRLNNIISRRKAIAVLPRKVVRK